MQNSSLRSTYPFPERFSETTEEIVTSAEGESAASSRTVKLKEDDFIREHGPNILLWAEKAELDDLDSFLRKTLKKHPDEFRLLLKPLMNYCDHRKRCAMSMACASGSIQFICFLLQRGADINGPSEADFPPLVVAVQRKKTDVCDLLLNPDRRATTSVDDLKNLSDDADHESYHLSIGSPHALYSALPLNVNLQVLTGNDGLRYGPTALISACFTNQPEIVRMLLAHPGIDVNIAMGDGGTALIAAANTGSVEICKMLTDSGAIVSQSMRNGATALFLAAQEGHMDCVRFLHDECRANIESPLSDETTPLISACHNGHTAVVRYLLSAGAAVNRQMNSGATALFVSCQAGHNECVALLLAHGAKTDTPMADGTTSLWVASCNGRANIVQMLLEKNARIDLACRGQTSFEIAKSRGHRAVASLISQFGSTRAASGFGFWQSTKLPSVNQQIAYEIQPHENLIALREEEIANSLNLSPGAKLSKAEAIAIMKQKQDPQADSHLPMPLPLQFLTVPEVAPVFRRGISCGARVKQQQSHVSAPAEVSTFNQITEMAQSATHSVVRASASKRKYAQDNEDKVKKELKHCLPVHNCHISELPDEALGCIVNHLNFSDAVCFAMASKRMARVTRNFLQVLDLALVAPMRISLQLAIIHSFPNVEEVSVGHISPQEIGHIIAEHPYLRRLEVSHGGCAKCCDGDLFQEDHEFSCNSLESLVLPSCSAAPYQIRQLIHKGIYLKSLSITGYMPLAEESLAMIGTLQFLESLRLPPTILHSIDALTSLGRLRSLDLSDCTLTENVLIDLGNRFRHQLQELVLVRVRGLPQDTFSINLFVGTYQRDILPLKRLDVTGLCLSGNWEQFFLLVPHLETFILEDSDLLDMDVSNFWASLTTSCSQMKTLKLGSSIAFTDHEMLLAANSFTELETLCVSNACLTDSLYELNEKLNTLKELRLPRCQSESTAIELRDCFPSLRLLDLSGCEAFNDTSLQHFMATHHFLEELSIDGTSVSEQAIRALQGDKIRILKLSPEIITRASLESLRANCPNLSDLRIASRSQSSTSNAGDDNASEGSTTYFRSFDIRYVQNVESAYLCANRVRSAESSEKQRRELLLIALLNETAQWSLSLPIAEICPVEVRRQSFGTLGSKNVCVPSS